MFRVPADTVITTELLGEFINKHKKEVASRYQKLKDAYGNKYEIENLKKKPEWKPDNRIPVNFAKYIVDTMNGFFMGIPVKVSSDDKSVSEYINFLDQYNDQDDNNAELSKICDIYGNGYEMYFVDEIGNIGITYLDPTEAFIIYDDSILKRPLYFVRYYKDADEIEHGSLSDCRYVRYFTNDGGYEWSTEEKLHGFDGVPATEYVENEEGIGIFESVLPLINAYNKAISEKAYLKILGPTLDEDGMKNIRSNRIINFDGEAEKLIVEFLQKPDGDTTQENLINRLERLIFQISMVANISDENFGTQSGIALKYRLLSMSNLGKTKERKFISGMNRRYRLIFSNPVSGMQRDAWTSIKYKFTQNIPANVLDEAQTASQLTGIVSKETQLELLSVVENVKDEVERIEKDTDKEGYHTDYPTNRTDTEEDK